MMTRVRKAARTADGRHGGFTFVELVIAMVIASIILAGMIGIVTMVFGNFDAHKNLQAATDSSRRALGTLTRELASTLKIVDGENTTDSSIEFWADVDGDNPSATVYDEVASQKAETVIWRLSDGNLVQVIRHAAPVPLPGGVVITDPDEFANRPHPNLYYEEPESIIARGVDTSGIGGFHIDYYKLGDKQEPPLTPNVDNLNVSTNMIEVTLKLKQGGVSRTFIRDVYLRVLDRVPEGYLCSIDETNPENAQRGQSLTVHITGTNTHFSSGQSTAYFEDGITVTSTTVTDLTHADANIVIAPTATLGYRDVYVNTGNPSEFPDPLTNGFEVK